MADLIVAIVGLALLGIGIWLHDPGWSLAVVGGLLFGCSVFAQFVKLPRKPPNA